MPTLYTIPAGESIAQLSAAQVLAEVPPEQLPHTLVLVPNRRSCFLMRQAFQQQLAGRTSLLPSILPFAEIEQALVTQGGAAALAALAAIPPAMGEAQQRYILSEYILAFERRRLGAATLDYALTLADSLMALQEQWVRSGAEITQAKLRQLVQGNMATHWQQALQFLAILTDHWPEVERALGMTTAAAREVAILHAAAELWRTHPPQIAVYAIGSTASQHSTALFLKTIADLPRGQVILPGLDPTMTDMEWEAIRAGHPLFHLKQFLVLWPVSRADVGMLGDHKPTIWMQALAPTEQMPDWRNKPLADYQPIHLIPCAHPEEEARVISLLLRETLEDPAQQVALITPDEGLMARAAAHLRCYGIIADRLNAGTLATTATGSVWAGLVAAIEEPERLLNLRGLLHHPLLAVDAELLRGLERGWYGVNRRQRHQLPRHDPALREHPRYAALAKWVEEIARISRQRLSAPQWIETCSALLTVWQQESGQGQEAIDEQLEQIAHAERFGLLDITDFAALLNQRLSMPWRDIGLRAHPQISMLTPVEARLQRFDRVILANMQDQIWPGLASPNPWLNLAAQAALGLPAPEEGVSLMAHDVLMLASHGEVFLTYPRRDQGSPATRSRFIERLVTLLATHGIAEETITDRRYAAWATQQDNAPVYAPEPEARPMPTREQRPRALPVAALDSLFTDPFSIYAKYVLGLRALDALDAEPEAKDFGQLAHKAAEALAHHWDRAQQPADEAQLHAIADHVLREFSERPNIDLFWRTRLMGGLRYINQLEQERRPGLTSVAVEQPIQAELSLPGAEHMLLQGRIDRLETRAGGVTVVDCKTGTPPSIAQILDGKALQLMAYAILLDHHAQPAEAVEYWALPKLGSQGEVTRLALDAENKSRLDTGLRAALSQMLDANTPFLARPVAGGDDRFGNDYDGISRYDEWAG